MCTQHITRVDTCHYNHDGDKIAVLVVIMISNQLFISPSLLEKIIYWSLNEGKTEKPLFAIGGRQIEVAVE